MLPAVVASIAFTACGAAPVLSPTEIARILKMSPLGAPPINETNRVADDERAAVLGQRLFFDSRLSPDGRFSCATCHAPAKSFTDGRGTGEGRVALRRNVPTLLDVGHQRWLNWDGSADSLWAQALRPIENPAEMGGDRVSVARLIATDPTLRRDYEAIFGALSGEVAGEGLPARGRPAPLPSPLATATTDPALEAAWNSMGARERQAVDAVFANVGKAIEAYERRLRSGESPFDRFVQALRDNDEAGRAAISPAAQRGAQLFVGSASCRLCHGGPALSDGEFHALGVPSANGFASRASPGGPAADSGRYEGLRILSLDRFGVGGEFSDRPDGPRAARVASLAKGPEAWGQFRTPSLRNVARTAPYMHAGQMAELGDVIRFYSTHEGRVVAGHHRETILEPLQLDGRQMADLVAFLESLTGTGPDARWLVAPPPNAPPQDVKEGLLPEGHRQ